MAAEATGAAPAREPTWARDQANQDPKSIARGRAQKQREELRQQQRVSPEELKLFQDDPLLEKRSGQTEFVVCRECGWKGNVLHDHVRKLHKITIDGYLEKWSFPPLASESHCQKQSKAKREWGTANGQRYFHTKDGVNKRHPWEPGRARGGKAPTPAMRRHNMELARTLGGVPRRDLRGRKLLGKNRQDARWVDAPPVDDGTIVEARLVGKLQREIADDVGRTTGAVQKVLGRVGVPAWNFRVYQCAPLTARRISTLAEDFGADLKRACVLLGLTYSHMLNRVREVHADRSISAELAAKVITGLARLTETYCQLNRSMQHSSNQLIRRYFSRKPIFRERQEQAEADVRRTWTQDPIALMEGLAPLPPTKGTPEVHRKAQAIN